MSNYENINESLIESSFLKGNIDEAGNYKWKKNEVIFEGHKHCIICNIPITGNSDDELYVSEWGMLCGFCYKKFVFRLSAYKP